jgi:hypothetical protein
VSYARREPHAFALRACGRLCRGDRFRNGFRVDRVCIKRGIDAPSTVERFVSGGIGERVVHDCAAVSA